MKKLSMVLVAICLFIGLTTNDVFARAIGIKGGYTMPKDDWSEADDVFAFGVYFDMGSFLINNLDFRPSVDMFTLQYEDTRIKDVWGIHMDWYWHFLDKGTFSPFIGFGPSLNYYNNDESSTQGDSDAGVDIFLGLDYKLSGLPLTLMLEGRWKFLDIANRDETAIQVNLGVAYNF